MKGWKKYFIIFSALIILLILIGLSLVKWMPEDYFDEYFSVLPEKVQIRILRESYRDGEFSYLKYLKRDHLTKFNPLVKSILDKDKGKFLQLASYPNLINIPDHTNTYPIHHIVTLNDFEALVILISQGVDVNVQDKNGITPLMLSLEKDRKIFDLILDQTTLLNTRDKFGLNVFMDAAALGKLYALKKLVNKGVEVKDFNNENLNALTLALLREQNEKVIRFLLPLFSADPSYWKGRLHPLTYIDKHPDKNIVYLVKQYFQ